MSLEKEHKNNNSGFTLIELSIVVIVIGISLAMYLSLYVQWKERKDFLIVENNIQNATAAINQFRAEVGRYPCPADPSLALNDPNFGAEDCSLAVVAPGVLIGSLPLYGYSNSNGAAPASPDDVIYLKDYLLDSRKTGSNIKDPWNETFKYAVTQSLANSNSYAEDGGVISIHDEFGNDTGGTNDNAHFAIISLGMDNRCGAGRNPAELDNCNDNDGTFVSSLFSTSSNLSNYYDDYVVFQRNANSSIWLPTNQSTGDIYPDDSNNANSHLHIGSLGHYNPANPVKLDVEGAIISDNMVSANLICDNGGTRCLRPQSLYNINCPTDGQYITSITINASGNFVVNCQDLDFQGNSMNCGVDRYVNSISTDGTVICKRGDEP